jgi:hypothetical protein
MDGASCAAIMLGSVTLCRGMEPGRETCVSIQHPEMGVPAGRDPDRLLEELKRIAVEQLGAVPAGLYRPIEEQLHDSLRVAQEGSQRKELMAVLALRQRGSGYVMKFRELIGRAFDEFCGRTLPGGHAAPMGLVRENELDFHLDGQRLAESIASRYQRPLEMLGLRFDSLAEAMRVPGTTNPVGATLLANAFVQTFRDADVTPSLRMLLFRQYEQELAKVLGELYGRLNTLLAAHGFHADARRAPAAATATPSPRPAPVPSAPASPGESSRQATGAWLEAGIGGITPEAPRSAPPTFEFDAAALDAAALDAGAFAPPAGPGTPAAPPAIPGFGQPIAAAPQRFEVPAPQAASAQAFRTNPATRVQHQQLRDMLHLWREGMAAGQGAARGATASGPDARRELRLQEVVSVASLLQRDGVRNFEAALAGKCELHKAIREELSEGASRLGLDPSQTRLDPQQEDAVDLTGMLFESLLSSHGMGGDARHLFARLVMSYVRVALTDDSLFVQDDHPARRLLDALALGCEGNDGVSAQDRELLDRAGGLVDRVVAEYNEDLAIFELTAREMQALLDQQRRRADIAERRSAETAHGRERLARAREVAARALADRMSGRTLTPTIAHFLERHWQHHLVQVLLREGEDSVRIPKVLAMADELVALDAAAAQGAGRDVATRVLALHPALVEALSSSGLDEQVASEWMAGLARTVAFPDAPREARQPHAAVQETEADEAAVLRVVGGTDGLDFDPAVAERMRALQPGDWMRLTDERGREAPVKVAWTSPLSGRLLLVNRRGIKQLVASPEQLAALVRSGHLFAEADEMPFDEAMRLVRQRLGRTASRAA